MLYLQSGYAESCLREAALSPSWGDLRHDHSSLFGQICHMVWHYLYRPKWIGLSKANNFFTCEEDIAVLSRWRRKEGWNMCHRKGYRTCDLQGHLCKHVCYMYPNDLGIPCHNRSVIPDYFRRITNGIAPFLHFPVVLCAHSMNADQNFQWAAVITASKCSIVRAIC